MEPLSPLDLLRVSTVLEDCVDQLSILGYIMPVSYEGRPDSESFVGDDIGRILKHQKKLQWKFKELMSSKSQSLVRKPHLEGEQQGDTAGDLKRSNLMFSRALEQDPLSAESLLKVQVDRQFAAGVIMETLSELQEFGTFQKLLLAVEVEKDKKANLYNIIVSEEEGRRRMKALQRQLQDIRKEKELELQRRNEMIAHLKDQLQEMKAKTGLEEKYMKKSCELQVTQGQKICGEHEHKHLDDIQRLKDKLDEETRSHLEIENFLKHHQTELEEKLEFWMEKYDKDIDAKQHELTMLKTAKANDLARLQELAKQYRECEQVVMEDRVEKENERKRRGQEELEYKSCTKIQAWWRGIMVRKCLGPYKTGKKGKKGKKGKGKGGGKKKKK
ncbi:dynein regulatory complex protein 9-like [Polyodon spathula]|uniref:dynein regulatory complex protein 9-like n=1 Tax=Polyodon spathula TaxID=7913 RepID=UPI001B7E4F96|nr:dynein regulatory complex protein 9-like [Polyodon spathula]XP_041120288.1 dynein regulatory complex protein 9-like [Polyodon spathula]